MRYCVLDRFGPFLRRAVVSAAVANVGLVDALFLVPLQTAEKLVRSSEDFVVSAVRVGRFECHHGNAGFVVLVAGFGSVDAAVFLHEFFEGLETFGQRGSFSGTPLSMRARHGQRSDAARRVRGPVSIVGLACFEEVDRPLADVGKPLCVRPVRLLVAAIADPTMKRPAITNDIMTPIAVDLG